MILTIFKLQEAFLLRNLDTEYKSTAKTLIGVSNTTVSNQLRLDTVSVNRYM